jgi:hypothetical protein
MVDFLMDARDVWYLNTLFNDSVEADEARDQVYFEKLLKHWVHVYSQVFEPGEYYDPRDTRTTFLKFCAKEFDRQLKDWPWNKRRK